ncbi:hypothetical protein NQX30_04800 [Candidatus Persebacteraceae bacterium Df01]|jgi:hypothetical protein|uniref:Uncharacterized protein n=1 Tax=Candidatus Doriopsillibacter californiensis TaxID=2970740 RepID=A0ABT7QLV9_9GAMM|nr:hypothetical protein [Candidatus Persebacteraceae bacterium Df01]
MNLLELPIENIQPQGVRDPLTIERVKVLPAANKAGAIKGRDGRVFNVADMGALAAALNRQTPATRVDIDHKTEKSAYSCTASKFFTKHGAASTDDNELFQRLEIIDTDWLSGTDFSSGTIK